MNAAITATHSSASAADTLAIGAALGRALSGGMSIGLTGPLGAGKTQLVKGIAAGNARGIDPSANTTGGPPHVTSPTFTLVHEYPGRLVLYHVDAYRLTGPDDLLALGFDEFARNDAAVVVEWADRVGPVMDDDCLWVALHPTGATARNISFRATGPRSARCLRAYQRAIG
ncbi:MAG: tRNA (adenosine(37)-N6)-threonylcarbamoyltransferase complex ATPase subunit type 1 TsaE [Phycisphaerae bacterium]